MKIEVDTVKGFRDYLPPESLQRAKIKKIVEKCIKERVVFRIVPRVLEVVLGKVKLDKIREIGYK